METLLANKKARFDYEIMETIEAGIELFGHEVKSIRKRLGSISGAYVSVRDNEVRLIGASIPPYQPGNTPEGYDQKRERRLLLHKKEIKSLVGREKEKGLTIIPLSLYNKRGRIKIAIGVGRGRKKYDKRERIKKRDAEREVTRTLKKQFKL